jgi:hypothetical protein
MVSALIQDYRRGNTFVVVDSNAIVWIDFEITRWGLFLLQEVIFSESVAYM